jgi:hypothetical protein
LFGLNGGSIGIGAPVCAEMKKAPVRGPLVGCNERESRGCASDGGASVVALLRAAHAKKPGAVSRPGTVCEFQFHE